MAKDGVSHAQMEIEIGQRKANQIGKTLDNLGKAIDYFFMNTTTPSVEETMRAGFPTLEASPASTGKAPVVLLHGAFADQDSFRGWVGRLAGAGHQTLAPARRGIFGRHVEVDTDICQPLPFLLHNLLKLPT